MADNLEITCPCCEATLVIDRASGAVLWHKEKKSSVAGRSLDSMVSELEAQKSEAAKKFQREIEAQKDKSRLLEEKFKEAMKRAEKSDKPPINPMDLD